MGIPGRSRVKAYFSNKFWKRILAKEIYIRSIFNLMPSNLPTVYTKYFCCIGREMHFH